MWLANFQCTKKFGQSKKKFYTEACEDHSSCNGEAACKEVPFIYGKVQSYINSGQRDPKTFLDSLQVSAKEL